MKKIFLTIFGLIFSMLNPHRIEPSNLRFYYDQQNMGYKIFYGLSETPIVWKKPKILFHILNTVHSSGSSVDNKFSYVIYTNGLTLIKEEETETFLSISHNYLYYYNYFFNNWQPYFIPILPIEES